ncbi:MAG: pyridine nucleotide-disulfide oxidoreductase, partial [Proteobacteria bacterium]|nr:pyridine nucleotide-disulfide oxidoreductase [Pseudomonadota bacterium]
MKADALTLAHGLSFGDLYDRDGLVRLDGLFLDALGAADGDLRRRLEAARAEPDSLTRLAESELIIDLAPHLEGFIGGLFGIGAELAALRGEHEALAPIFEVRRNFVQRRAVKKIKADAAAALDGDALAAGMAALLGGPVTELSFARAVAGWLADEDTNSQALATAESYAAWATLSDAGRARHDGGVLFKEPGKLDFDHLVHHMVSEETIVGDAANGATCHRLDANHLRRREGFALTDAGVDLAGALGEANYCIWCHKQGRDSCSTGLREKAAKDAAANAAPPPFRKNPFGISLAGCPLEEKISEFQKLKAEGCSVGAFATMIIDNPMVAGTGHRICNDCMKSCVYQKQDPVDIPQAETRTLKDVLALPWGFEIYSLLSRWNPLNLTRPYPESATNKKVLVVGMG